MTEDAPRSRTVTLDQMFPGTPRWELIRSINPLMVRYRIPLRLQIVMHEAKAERCKS